MWFVSLNYYWFIVSDCVLEKATVLLVYMLQICSYCSYILIICHFSWYDSLVKNYLEPLFVTSERSCLLILTLGKWHWAFKLFSSKASFRVMAHLFWWNSDSSAFLFMPKSSLLKKKAFFALQKWFSASPFWSHSFSFGSTPFPFWNAFQVLWFLCL